MDQKYVKVTIIVEDDDEVTTMTIPKATEVHTETSQKHEWQDLPNGTRRPRSLGFLDLVLNLTAYSFDETGVIMTTEYQEKNKPRALADVISDREKLDAEYAKNSEALMDEFDRLMDEKA